MLSYRIVLVAACLLCSRVCTMAQQIAAPPQPPTVMFELSWNQGMPWSDYSFSVMENGATHFKGTVNAAENGQSDSFEQDFTMSEVSLQKIFQSAKAADYFQGHFEGKQKNIAKTGTKTLAFHGPAIDSSTTYGLLAQPEHPATYEDYFRPSRSPSTMDVSCRTSTVSTSWAWTPG